MSKNKAGNPDVHKELEGFNIQINEFGEISTSMQVDKINRFLDENVEDKKLKEKEEKSKEEQEE